jgi:HemY protein
VEQALLTGDRPALRAAVEALADETPTARLCGLLARAAMALGQTDEARAWIARGAAAPQEPDWSDLDPEGRAFAYAPADWARLVTTWADTGELAHPRFERRERTLSDLPELPERYEASAPFVPAGKPAGPFAPLPDDPGPYADALAGPDAPAPRPAARPSRRRRAGGLGKGSGSV